MKIKQHKLSEIQKNTRDIYERLLFEQSSLSSPEVTAEGRAQFHEAEYLRVLGLNNARRRFFCLDRMLKAVISGDNSRYTLRAPDEWLTISYPLTDEIIQKTPSTKAK